jgi:Uma2 family endonuclease
MSANPKIIMMTYADFDRYASMPANRDRLLELFEGEVIEKMPTQRHGIVAIKIGARLLAYAEKYGGRVGTEIRHKLPKDDDNALQPDVAYYHHSDEPIIERGATPYMPTVAIEIKSPDDNLRLMRQKADYYLANGSQAVWIIHPGKRLVIIYTSQDEQILNMDDIITLPNILPHFELPVSYIFD